MFERNETREVRGRRVESSKRKKYGEGKTRRHSKQDAKISGRIGGGRKRLVEIDQDNLQNGEMPKCVLESSFSY